MENHHCCRSDSNCSYSWNHPAGEILMKYEEFEPYLLSARKAIYKLLPNEEWDDFYEDYIEALLKADYHHDCPIFPFLRTILKNRIADYYRRKDTHTRLQNEFMNQYRFELPATRISTQNIEISDLIRHLPDSQQVIMRLSYQGYKVPEISKKLGLNQDQVWGRFKRARAKMKELIK